MDDRLLVNSPGKHSSLGNWWWVHPTDAWGWNGTKDSNVFEMWEWVFAIWLNTHIISVLSVVIAMTVMLNDGLLVLPGQLERLKTLKE